MKLYKIFAVICVLGIAPCVFANHVWYTCDEPNPIKAKKSQCDKCPQRYYEDGYCLLNRSCNAGSCISCQEGERAHCPEYGECTCESELEEGTTTACTNKGKCITCTADEGTAECKNSFNQCFCVPEGAEIVCSRYSYGQESCVLSIPGVNNVACNDYYCIACLDGETAKCSNYGECVCEKYNENVECGTTECITCSKKEEVVCVESNGWDGLKSCICKPEGYTVACDDGYFCIACSPEQGTATCDPDRVGQCYCEKESDNNKCEEEYGLLCIPCDGEIIFSEDYDWGILRATCPTTGETRVCNYSLMCTTCQAGQEAICSDYTGCVCVDKARGETGACSWYTCKICSAEEGTATCSNKNCYCAPSGAHCSEGGGCVTCAADETPICSQEGGCICVKDKNYACNSDSCIACGEGKKPQCPTSRGSCFCVTDPGYACNNNTCITCGTGEVAVCSATGGCICTSSANYACNNDSCISCGSGEKAQCLTQTGACSCVSDGNRACNKDSCISCGVGEIALCPARTGDCSCAQSENSACNDDSCIVCDADTEPWCPTGIGACSCLPKKGDDEDEGEKDCMNSNDPCCGHDCGEYGHCVVKYSNMAGYTEFTPECEYPTGYHLECDGSDDPCCGVTCGDCQACVDGSCEDVLNCPSWACNNNNCISCTISGGTAQCAAGSGPCLCVQEGMKDDQWACNGKTCITCNSGEQAYCSTSGTCICKPNGYTAACSGNECKVCSSSQGTADYKNGILDCYVEGCSKEGPKSKCVSCPSSTQEPKCYDKWMGTCFCVPKGTPDNEWACNTKECKLCPGQKAICSKTGCICKDDGDESKTCNSENCATCASNETAVCSERGYCACCKPGETPNCNDTWCTCTPQGYEWGCSPNGCASCPQGKLECGSKYGAYHCWCLD